MPNAITRQQIKQIGVYLCNNVPYTDIEIRKTLLQCLVGLAFELGISFKEFCELIEQDVIDEKVKN
jgi:hypothetical protein